MEEEALRGALKSGKLGGLALDVFHSEPIKENDEYFNYDNVILTPHIAGSGRDVIFLQSRDDCETICCCIWPAAGRSPL